MKIFTLNYRQGLLVDRFLKTYLKGFFDRIKGYTFFTSLILTLLQVGAVLFAQNDSVLNVLNIILKAFGDVATGVAQPNEITMVATSITAIWGLILKLIKSYKGEPQVPTIVIKKRS